MNFLKNRSLVTMLAFASVSLVAQDKTPAPQTPSQSAQPQSAQPGTSPQAGEAKPPDHAASYYHYGMTHMYEEMMAMYGRSEYAGKAVAEHRKASDADRSSQYRS